MQAPSTEGDRTSMQASEEMSPKRPLSDANQKQMTRAWKDVVRAELVHRGWSLERLAKETRVSRSLIYRMFPARPRADEIWHSSAVGTVCEVLGVPPPMQPTELQRSDEDLRLTDLIRVLPDDAKLTLLRFIEALLGGKRR